MINSRNKGKAFENATIRWLRRWFPDAKSSRLASKERDSCGVDACDTGFINCQFKAVENLGLIHNVLADMPDEPGQINVVMHKVNRKGTIVAMSQESFGELLEMLKGNGAF